MRFLIRTATDADLDAIGELIAGTPGAEVNTVTAARFGAPLLVWTGAVAAMVTKGALAASIGAGVRQWIIARIPPNVVRYAGVSALIVLGLLSVLETLTEGHA